MHSAHVPWLPIVVLMTIGAPNPATTVAAAATVVEAPRRTPERPIVLTYDFRTTPDPARVSRILTFTLQPDGSFTGFNRDGSPRHDRVTPWGNPKNSGRTTFHPHDGRFPEEPMRVGLRWTHRYFANEYRLDGRTVPGVQRARDCAVVGTEDVTVAGREFRNAFRVQCTNQVLGWGTVSETSTVSGDGFRIRIRLNQTSATWQLSSELTSVQ